MMKDPSQGSPSRPGPDFGVQSGQDGALVSAWLTDLRFAWGDATQGARQRRLAKEETLFLGGDAADTTYVIEEGRIRLTSYSFDGKERHLMIIGPNGLVGDCGLLCAANYLVSAVAASDAVVRAVPTARMLGALAQYPLLMRQHLELASMRFRIMLQHLALQGANSARRRVCHHLLGLMNSYGAPHRDGSVISIAFTQQEMGNICGLSRVSVSQIFTLLEREDVIARAGRLIVIRNAPGLAQRSRT